MPTLDTLPVPLLLDLASHLASASSPFSWPLTRITHGRYMPFSRPSADLVALASTNKRLREVLRERAFRCLEVGELREGLECSESYQEEVEWLASEEGERVLRALWIAPLLPRGIEALAKCLERMPNLQQVVYSSSLPFPSIFVDPLLALDSFTSLHFDSSSVESLPHILPLARKVTDLSLETRAAYPVPKESLDLCPVTVAYERRRLVPWDMKNLPTREEQFQALVDGLVTYLHHAQDTLEMLVVDGSHIAPHCDALEWTTSPPSTRWFEQVFRHFTLTRRAFPRIERLALNFASVKSEVMDELVEMVAGRIRWLDIDGFEREYVKPPAAFPRLEFFRTIFADKVSVAAFVLTLNGLIPHEIPQIFYSSIACRETLRELVLQTLQAAPFYVGELRVIALSCPNLELVDLKATWGGEAVDFLDALSSLRKLRTFSFDHPWEKPSGPRPWVDGRTIRSDRNGDFQVISCFGTSIEHEMRRRILEDIDAVRPTYTTRFLAFASDHPLLTLLVWHATEVVEWYWRFKRVGAGVAVESDYVWLPYKEDVLKAEGENGEEGEEKAPAGVFARFPVA
ncbi:hypothetical protein JCM10020v2_003904 [Rhodotorula toruloides]